MTTKYWQARAYEAETREMELREALMMAQGAIFTLKLGLSDEVLNLMPGLQNIEARIFDALAKDDDPEPRFELEE